jgi:GNAT superfamily N-acetyltransferase
VSVATSDTNIGRASEGEIEVVPLEEAAYPAAARIVARSVRAAWAGQYPESVIETVARQNGPAWIRKRSAKQEDFLARRGGEAVGYAAVKENEIGHLFVPPESAGSGVGTALVSFAEDLLRERGYESAIVYASLPAVGFYEKQGFRCVRPKSFDLGDGVMLDSILMEKPL